MDRSFGLALKDWRRRRRVSQLALSGEANVSARHIAFLETGRARPSRGMVLQLSEALAIPRAERNALLQAAGFAVAYKARDFADADVAALRQA
ncbi:MAG: helix-turn-helix transcriptional regulator, partial [Aestuariivirga sp.]